MHSSYVQFVIPKATSSAVTLFASYIHIPYLWANPLTKITHLKNVHVSLLVLHHRPTDRTGATLAPVRTPRPGLKCNLLECVSHEIRAPNLHCFPTIKISHSFKQRFFFFFFFLIKSTAAPAQHTWYYTSSAIVDCI
jgi:hypothetical protein